MAADSWGLSWGGTTGSWLTSWASTFVPPTPAEPTQTAAGRAKRKRYYVEIDGQTFEVKDVQHAQALLDRAKEVARSHAEELAKEALPATKKIGRKPIKLPTPSISSPNPELKEVISTARKTINDVYRQAAIDVELAMLLAKRMAEEIEEEETLLLLM